MNKNPGGRDGHTGIPHPSASANASPARASRSAPTRGVCERSREPGLSRSARWVFFQGEDGIRDYKVTGVQTCALPISFAVHTGHVHDAAVLLRIDQLFQQNAN